MVEVNGRCGFTRELAPVGGYSPRLKNRYATLLAALVAHGTHLGIATMTGDYHWPKDVGVRRRNLRPLGAVQEVVHGGP